VVDILIPLLLGDPLISPSRTSGGFGAFPPSFNNNAQSPTSDVSDLPNSKQYSED